ncbi:hypothetical protein QBC34DRAFT_143486 [Podospora aff. communis PSN243]|uniref:Clr5 domain-containing protein n=1 Tax=Podospora aff. communis PSN243 TaxID=3040156 RepID=A0AAV9GGX9_9PEZI|nr:hypothetical protein QBC34DRAFT_143486 [Podospora aff. communis PSN243]
MELDWERFRARLFEYWIKQNLNVKQVAKLIASEGLKVSHETFEEKLTSPEWPEFQKKKVTHQIPCRRRKIMAPPSNRASISDYPTITRNARLSLYNRSQLYRSPGPGATPGRDLNLQVDRMVLSIRRLATGLFDVDRSRSYPPCDPSTMSSWQLVYDECVGLDSAGSIRSTRPEKMLFLWDRALGQLETAAKQARSAAFLAHLWGICGRLLDIKLISRLRSNPSAILRIFLCRARQSLIATMGPTDELVVVLESILCVMVSAPTHLKRLLSLGSMETASALNRTVGGNHPLVLKTLSAHYQCFWKLGSPVDGEQLKQHKHRVERIDFESPSEDDMEALYTYTITQRHISPREIPQLAAFLFRHSLRQCQADS